MRAFGSICRYIMAEPENINSGASSTDSAVIIEGGDVGSLDELKMQELRNRSATARTLATILTWTLGLSVLVHYAATVVCLFYDKTAAVEGLNKIFNIWLPVISGLVGSATTYYFTREGKS